MKHVWQIAGSHPIHVWTNEVEASAETQLRALAKLPFLHPHGLAVMPDVHAGIGSTVGSVIATIKAIIPAAVGVDIGCGMNAVRTSLKATDLPESLTELRNAIEALIPLGPGGAHKEITIENDSVAKLRANFENVISPTLTTSKVWQQLGTLGSGNHFIEICLDEHQSVWVVLHSGSRGIGNQIGRYFIDRAKKNMERWFITLPDADLAYLPEGAEDFEGYVHAVQWAQDYATENRRQLMARTLGAMDKCLPYFTLTDEAINCHHNYVELENHFGRNVYVTRKGAIRARAGDLGVIPGSMGAQSFIVRGLGNLDSYCSCAHGAGRKMSRSEAKRTFTVRDLERQTAGIECRKDDSVLDEIPGAYKNINHVMENQRDLVEVVHTLHQVLCVKGG